MKSLQLHKYTVRVRLRQIQNVNQAHEDLRALDKQSPDPESDSLAEKYIVLNLSTESAYEEILKQDFLSLGMERYRHGGVNVTGFQLVNYSSQFVKNFMTVWRTLDPKVWPGAHEHSIHVEAALAVDSITVIQKTISKMVERSSSIFQHTFRRGDIYNYNKTKGVPCTANPPIPWMHGQSLMAGMTELKFDGVTGNVGFDRFGFRKDYTFDVFNVGLDEGPTKIGGWSSNYGFTADRAEEQNDVKVVSNTSKVYIVTSIQAEPFLMVKQTKKGGKPYLDNDRYEGYCVDMTYEVAKFIGFDYRIELVHDNMFGKKMENGSWNGMIGELLDNKADLAVAPLTITMEREKEVHFSKPFMNVGISIMIKKPEKKKPGVFSFMQPFTLELWLAIVISYFVVGAVVFLVCRISHEEWQRPMRFGQQRFNIFTLPNSLWFTMGSLMLQGSDDTCPRSTSGRIVGGAWWSVVLICISSYTANLAAFLTIEKLLTPIESADDLVKQSEIAYGTLDSGSTEEFFMKSNVPTYKAMANYMLTAHPSVFVSTIEEGISRVQNSKGKYAFLLESVYNEYANSRKPCDTMRVGPNLNSNSYGIATTKTSILRDEVTYAVLSLTEDGTLLKLKKKWWVDKGECGFDTGHRLIYMMPADTVVTLIEGNHVNHIEGENGTIPPPVRKENHTNSHHYSPPKIVSYDRNVQSDKVSLVSCGLLRKSPHWSVVSFLESLLVCQLCPSQNVFSSVICVLLRKCPPQSVCLTLLSKCPRSVCVILFRKSTPQPVCETLL
ncbi:hypothetical protein ACJMK2_030634 [Sinanodonta woodiana]|uniref:Glutamate receptor n=1 Tax=Sinanodonta woodiana TaxID=1069815 RepID=A0ABD3WWB7_SINWO